MTSKEPENQPENTPEDQPQSETNEQPAQPENNNDSEPTPEPESHENQDSENSEPDQQPEIEPETKSEEEPKVPELNAKQQSGPNIEPETGAIIPELVNPESAPEPVEAAQGDLSEDLAQKSLRKAVSSSFLLLQAIMAIILLLVVGEGFQYVEEGTVAVKKRFGQFVKDGSGNVIVYRADSKFVFVLPYPLEELEVIPLRAETLKINTEFWPLIDKAKLALQEGALPKQPNLDPSKDGYNLTADFNIVHSQWQVEYKIKDPVQYLLSVAGKNMDEINAASKQMISYRVHSSIVRTIAGANVNSILTGDVSATVFSDVTQQFAENPCGIEIMAVNPLRILPPGVTQKAFNDVTSALTRQKTLENNAQSAANTTLGRASVQAKKLVFNAEVAARRNLERARADAEALNTLLKKFPNNPEGLRVYLEQYRQTTMQDVLSKADIQTQPKSQPGSMILGPVLEEDQNKLGGGR